VLKALKLALMYLGLALKDLRWMLMLQRQTLMEIRWGQTLMHLRWKSNVGLLPKMQFLLRTPKQ
jgi:hypothetical protein